jgi:hypothetical protein
MTAAGTPDGRPSLQSPQAVYPPLESITAPVMYEAAGLARKAMTGAVSAGSLTR